MNMYICGGVGVSRVSHLGTLYLDEMNHKSGFFICHSDPKFEIGFWNWVENEDLFWSLYKTCILAW